MSSLHLYIYTYVYICILISCLHPHFVLYRPDTYLLSLACQMRREAERGPREPDAAGDEAPGRIQQADSP